MAKGFAGTVFLTTEDCQACYEELKARGVEFVEAPEERPYGIDSGFRDPSGNNFRLTEVKLPARPEPPLAAGNGRNWARTSDLQLVELALSQLSYAPGDLNLAAGRVRPAGPRKSHSVLGIEDRICKCRCKG